MRKKRLHLFSLAIFIILGMLLSACGNSDNDSNKNAKDDTGESGKIELGEKNLSLPYVSWASTVAGVHVAKSVLEDLGYNIDIMQVEAGVMFSGIADGTGDFSVGAVTLPTTHKDYWEKYEDQVDDLGVTMDQSVTIGLAVPEYMDIDSLEDLEKNTNDIGDKLGRKIVGIDPGAGQMQITKNEVMPGYGLDKWELQSSSGAVMTAALKKAMDAHDPVVVTLWEPHWAFIEWDLKYLEDPKNLFGDPDSLHAIARKGLKEDAPAAHKMLKQFQWTSEDMGKVMVDIQDGMDPDAAAKKWIENNKDKVNKWLKGIK